MRLRATRRFVDGHKHAQPLRKACAIGAITDLRRAYESSPKGFLRKYKKVRGMSIAIWEMDISGADRLLFHFRDETVHLLAIGGHEIVEHYKDTAATESELRNSRPLPPEIEHLAATGFFTFDVEEDWKQFANEADPSWLTCLDRQQAAAVDRVLKRLDAGAANPRSWCFTLILGGPGTGKTSILINLFSRALEQNLIPQVIMEDQVADFLRDAGQDLDAWRLTLEEADAHSEGGILLIDDPHSIRMIRRLKSLAQLRRYRAVVVAVDPLQLSTDATDQEIEQQLTGTGAEAIQLHNCYRQKKVVGQATKKALDTIAASSPFLRADKKEDFASERAVITSASNNLTFSNPSGRSKVYPTATVANLQTEVRRLMRAPGLWSHAKPYLVAQDDESLTKLPAGWKTCLNQLGRVDWIKMSDATSVKGIEYQHVILLLSEQLFLQLENGFEGATGALYNQRRLYRIPMSRAKDSITVFVTPTH